MKRTVTHKHLKKQFDIFNETNEIDELFLELEFSTLLIPVSIENGNVAFPTISFEGKKHVPVFTDVHEYEKADFDQGLTLMPNTFDFYLNLLDEGFEGIIIDVEGERFPITREFKDWIQPSHILDYDQQVFTAKEMKRINDSIDNYELDEFLKDPANYWDFERLMEVLLKSDLYTVVASKDDLSSREENGVISLHGIPNLPKAYTGENGFAYATIFLSVDEINVNENGKMHPYLQMVNLPELINSVLEDDFDGIVLNKNSQNIMIPRQFLLHFMKDFTCPIICKYDDYAFVIG